jgi:cohesin complex subunit SA-1/2
VFVLRYRDVSPDLRALCIKSLGGWVLVYQSVMLETRFVKYLGWALFDPKPNVRLEAVKALTELYKLEV